MKKAKDEIKEVKKTEKIISKFKLKTIAWKAGSMVWEFVIGIKNGLDKASIQYTAKLIFDEDPYIENIKYLEEELEDLKKDNQLFKENKEEQLEDKKKEIKMMKEDMEKSKKEHPEIEFAATALKIDWSGNMPSVTFGVDSEFIGKMNNIKSEAEFAYKIELTPLK